MTPNEEKVVIVDRMNRESGTALRSEMRRQRLIHRASYILVFNGRQELYLQKRTPAKDIYPGRYDIAAGGVVLAGETYEQSAERELFEELGIKGVPLLFHFDHFYSDEDNKVWGRIFSCRHEEPFVLQEEEVESGEFLSIDLILSMMHSAERFTPDGIEILSRFIGMKASFPAQDCT
jgi:8-oxo-dGTP pyrophosphatase MutT (NUDIX family)